MSSRAYTFLKNLIALYSVQSLGEDGVPEACPSSEFVCPNFWNKMQRNSDSSEVCVLRRGVPSDFLKRAPLSLHGSNSRSCCASVRTRYPSTILQKDLLDFLKSAEGHDYGAATRINQGHWPGAPPPRPHRPPYGRKCWARAPLPHPHQPPGWRKGRAGALSPHGSVTLRRVTTASHIYRERPWWDLWISNYYILWPTINRKLLVTYNQQRFKTTKQAQAQPTHRIALGSARWAHTWHSFIPSWPSYWLWTSSTLWVG